MSVFFRYSLQQLLFPTMSPETMGLIGGIALVIFWFGIIAIFLDDMIDEDIGAGTITLIVIVVDIIFSLLFFFNIFIVIGFFGLLAGLLLLQRNWWEIKNAIKERRKNKKAVTSKREKNLSKK